MCQDSPFYKDLLNLESLGVRHTRVHVVTVVDQWQEQRYLHWYQCFCMKMWWHTMLHRGQNCSTTLVDFGGMYLPLLARAMGKTLWCKLNCDKDQNLEIILQE